MLNTRKSSFFITIFVFLFLLGLLDCTNPSVKPSTNATVKNNSSASDKQITLDESGLNRHPQRIHFSKHAKCRMDCRHIDETEIKEILETGTINFHKSALNAEPCRRKFAVEGPTKEGQHLRVIFAPCGNEITVVTCIDLGVEWACDCK